MKFLKLIAVTSMTFSTFANAAIITHGNLTTDNTTNFIADTVTGRQYLRFDTFNLSYADTVAATGTAGIYEGWSIATSSIADQFYSAVLGVSDTPCSGAVNQMTSCGNIMGWTDGDFGDSTGDNSDAFWYISTYETPNSDPYDIGYGTIFQTGLIENYDDWMPIEGADYFGGESFPDYQMNALLYRDVAAVPIPTAIWLFGSGLIGLVGFARRKKA
ncbi:MAG: VPLPA-CTERM sorting domain-containing protein [Candidatus Thiodiazotropha sp. (ex Lucinoma borealis)]|nr:VPLPA-CTERM sorting domain-containing protein [Candidatus Thiodiazotropha sp. (ex Lucinoma borealis)]